MASILVATVGDKKIYYVLDSKDSKKDGILENEDGTTVEISFFSYIGKTTKIKPLRSSNFHKFLWDEPSGKNREKWMEIFIEKIDTPNQNMLDGVVIQESTGKARKKKTSIDIKVNAFINNNSVTNSRGLNFSTKMIVFESKKSSKEGD